MNILISTGVAMVLLLVAVNGWAFDPDVATDAYLASVSPEDKARSDAYFEGGYWLQLIGLIYSLGVAWLVLNFGLSARMRDWSENKTNGPKRRALIYGVQYLVLTTLLFFPLSLYQDFFREHSYELSNQSFTEWLSELAMAASINLVIGAVLITLVYVIVRRAGKNWWVWTAGLLVLFIAFGRLIGPVYLSPLFNEYKALESSPVQQTILSMAKANGVPVDNVYQFDASKQSTRISANVSGLFGTTRISLNDNLMKRSTPEEVASVMGHEIGHYALGHAYEGTIYIAIVLVFGLAFIDWAFLPVIRRWGQYWGVRGKDDPAGLPVAIALLGVYFFIATPVTNSIIRSNESEADVYGLNAAREPDGFANIALKLGEYRKLDPNTWEEILFFDHPSGRTRIQMAMDWKAENLPSED